MGIWEFRKITKKKVEGINGYMRVQKRLQVRVEATIVMGAN
jgi:hypothetical protein